ncbi:MAG TPA: HK97 gp10 family phage protein [Saprospiraceae bacterium]|nr:HK97 gp10 family phage protein [Saprospiraceae bacterium]
MTVDQQINNIVANMGRISSYLDKSINAKTILKRASKVAVQRMKSKAPVGDTGNLERSVGFVSARKAKGKVLIGPRYGKGGGNHANLIEFGFIHPSGKRVEGQPFVLETYQETKDQILANLRAELKKEFDKAGRSLPTNIAI